MAETRQLGIEPFQRGSQVADQYGLLGIRAAQGAVRPE